MRAVSCNLCGEKREFDPVFADPSANLRVVRCRGCGLVFVNPTFTPQEHFQYYNSVYWNDMPTDSSGSYTNIPVDRVERWQKRAKAHIDYLCTFCEHVKTSTAMHVLEIGCGYGAHLDEVHRRFPQARLMAVEPNLRMHKSLRQRLPDVQILGKTLETLSGSHMLFDCIIAVDVLERTVDPTSTCRRIYAMLANAGVCLLITHNLAGRQGHVYDLSHLYYFTEGTLHTLLTNCHLSIVRLDIRGEFGGGGDDRIYTIVKKK
jgi:cyclopropane fatty-acyl-phospholipid synthase-like methyltransferase